MENRVFLLLLNKKLTEPPYFSHMSTKMRRITIDTASSSMSLNLMIIHVCTLLVALQLLHKYARLYI